MKRSKGKANPRYAIDVAGLAQTNGGIEGNVTDSSQAAIPGVIVKVTNAATGVVTPTTTNGAGYFSGGGVHLQPGHPPVSYC